MELPNGLQIQGGSLTFRLQNDGTCDSIDFSGASSAYPNSPGISFITTSVRATVNLTGVPLPLTGSAYTIITGDYSNGGSGNPTAVANQMLLNCPLGYSGTWGSQKGNYYGVGQCTNYSVTLTGPTQWTGWSSSNLSDSGNWTSGVPSQLGGVGLFGAEGSGGTISVLLPSGGSSLHGLIFASTGTYNPYNPSSYVLTSASSADTLSLTGVYNEGSYTGTGEVEVVNGSHQISAPVVLAADTNVTMYDPAASLTVTGNISGTGSLTLAGTGALILAGDNTYSGGTTVAGGDLYVTQSSAMLDGTPLTIGAGGAFIFDPTAFGSSMDSRAAGDSGSLTASPVPEPGTLAILAAGALACLAVRARRRWRSPPVGWADGHRA